jgi:hypothetical protein
LVSASLSAQPSSAGTQVVVASSSGSLTVDLLPQSPGTGVASAELSVGQLPTPRVSLALP